MTFDSLKQACDGINVTFSGNLLFYHKEIVGRYYHNDDNELVCDVLSIGVPYPVEGLNNENEIMNCLVKAIKYFKKLENEKRLRRIENDF
jgi:hypothetical protein